MSVLSVTPSVSVESDRLVLHTQLHQKDLAKAVPGARWDPTNKRWTAPLSWGVLWSLRAVFGQRIEADDSVRDWAAAYQTKNVAPLESLRDDINRESSGISVDDRLMPFQRAGVEFLTIAKRVLLADEMGTGKTIQAIEAGNRLDPERVLVICPNSMKYTWQREIASWNPRWTVSVVDGGVKKRREQIEAVASGDADVLIINWEALRFHSRLAAYGSIALNKCEKHGGDKKPGSCEVHPKELNAINWDLVVADEAHRLKNPKAKQTRAAWYVAHQQESHRFALTGTPIANHPGELWSLLHFLSPADWPSRVKYVDMFCLTGWNPWGGNEILDLSPQNRPYFDKIFLPMFLRRPKKLVLPQLPEKTYVTRDVPMTPKQRKAYRELRDQFITELDQGGIAFVTNPLVKVTRLLQLCSSYMEIDNSTGETIWRRTNPSSKIADLLEFLDDAEGERVVVFAESKQLINLAEEALTKGKVSYASITGDVHPMERSRVIEAFQSGQKRVVLATLGVGGEGITLTAADVVFFMERSWSMVKNSQAEDRVHRIGLEHPVLIVDQVTPDSLEEHRVEVLADKELKLESLVQDEAQLRRLLDA